MQSSTRDEAEDRLRQLSRLLDVQAGPPTTGKPQMKMLSIAGIVLVLGGAFVLIKGMSYPAERNVLTVGDLQVSAESRRSVPPWVGGIAIVGGLALIGAGMKGKRFN